MFRLPLIYAAVAGLAVNLAQIRIPELLLQPIVMLGQATIPIMLISLGYRLYQVESLQLDHALGGSLLRVFGGFATANIAVNLDRRRRRQSPSLAPLRRPAGCRRQLRFYRKVSPGSRPGSFHRCAEHTDFGVDHADCVLA